MSAAIDRFLYRATADAALDQFDIAHMDLENLLNDLFNSDLEGASKSDLIEHINYLHNCAGEWQNAAGRLRDMVSDLVEANRP